MPRKRARPGGWPLNVRQGLSLKLPQLPWAIDDDDPQAAPRLAEGRCPPRRRSHEAEVGIGEAIGAQDRVAGALADAFVGYLATRVTAVNWDVDLLELATRAGLTVESVERANLGRVSSVVCCVRRRH